MILASWLRRRVKWLVAAGILLLVYALFGFLAVPWIVRGQIGEQARAYLGREATTEQVRFNPFSLALSVEGFSLADRDGHALLAFDRVRIDLQASGVFRRAWRFREILIERPIVLARILEDGRPSVADLMEPGSPPPEDEGPFSPPRLIVDRLALTSGRIEFSDHSRRPAFEWGFAPLNLEVRDLITMPQEHGEHTVVIGVGEGAELRWSGTQTVEPLRLTGRFDIKGINLRRVWEYFGHEQPVEITEGRAGVVLPYDLQRAPSGDLALSVQGASLDVRDLVARPRGGAEDWLRVPELQGRDVDAAWPAARVRIAGVRIARPFALVRLEETGEVNWAGLFAPGGIAPEEAPPAGGAREGDRSASAGSGTTPPAESGPSADGSGPRARAPGGAPESAPSGDAANATSPAPEVGRSFDVRIGALEIEGGSARLEDLTTDPDVGVDLSDLALRTGEISSDLAAKVTLDASARLDEAGSLRASGSVTPEPLAAEVDLEAAGVDMLPLRAYVEMPGIRLASGVASLRGKGKLSGARPAISFAGGGSIEGIEILDAPGERLLACERIGVEGLRLDQAPLRVRIKEVSLDRAFARLHIDREGNINLTNLAAGGEATASHGEATTPPGETTVAPVEMTAPPAETGAPAGSPDPPRIEIGTVSLTGGSIDFADQSLILPFQTQIHSAVGALHDLSTFGAAAATLALEGRVAETGYVKVSGGTRLADPFASTDVEVHFRSLEMPTLTPYAATFAGYAIEHGLLDLDVRYRVQDRRLVGDHRLVASDLVLGSEVEGAESPGLAVRLAVALLKDKDGRINLDVPIEGSVDSPEFAYRKVVWQAIKTILGNIAKAPFRALGRLFGRDEEDLELVEFDPGRSDLLPAEQDKLAKLAAEMGPRAELALEIEGRFDPVSDPAALRRMKLDAMIGARRAAATEAEDSGGPAGTTLETILEALFAEQLSAEALEAERRAFTAAAPEPAPAAGQAEAAEGGRRGKKPREAPPPPPSAPAAPAAFDAAGFYESLRAKLLEAQTVSEADLASLASARTGAILAALTASGVLEPSRVKALGPAPVKRRKAGSERIASEMTMSARRASEDEAGGGP